MTKWQLNFHFFCYILKYHTKLRNFYKKKSFDSMFSLESDKMTASSSNAILTFTFYSIISNSITNWETFEIYIWSWFSGIPDWVPLRTLVEVRTIWVISVLLGLLLRTGYCNTHRGFDGKAMSGIFQAYLRHFLSITQEFEF